MPLPEMQPWSRRESLKSSMEFQELKELQGAEPAAENTLNRSSQGSGLLELGPTEMASVETEPKVGDEANRVPSHMRELKVGDEANRVPPHRREPKVGDEANRVAPHMKELKVRDEANRVPLT